MKPERTITNRRVRAGILDFIGVFLIAVIVISELTDSSAHSTQVWASLAMILGLNLIYHGVMELTLGRSLGKQMYGLKVRSLAGDRPTRTQTLIRTVARIVDFLPNLYILGLLSILAVEEPSQRVGDRWAHTCVVSAR